MNPHAANPDQRPALNAALLLAGTDTGFWDEHAHPAPWPWLDDIDEWRPTTGEPISTDPGQQPS